MNVLDGPIGRRGFLKFISIFTGINCIRPRIAFAQGKASSDDSEYIWAPSRDAQGNVLSGSVSGLPLNKWVRVQGVTPRQLELDHVAAGFNWPEKVWQNRSLNAQISRAWNSWSGGALDTDLNVFWIPAAGGHADSSYNGVAGLDLNKMAWRIGRLPSDPDAPGTEWSRDYKKLTSITSASYSNYYPPPSVNPPDVLPDGSWTSTHSYNGVVYNPNTKSISRTRFSHWSWKTDDSDLARNIWTFDGGQVIPSIYNQVFYDRHHDKYVGYISLKASDYWSWHEADPYTNEIKRLESAGLAMGATLAACQHGDLIYAVCWDTGLKKQVYGIWDMAKDTWIKLKTVVINGVNYLEGGRYAYDAQMYACTYIPQWGKLLLRFTHRTLRGRWFTIDVNTDECQEITFNQPSLPVANHPGNKMFYSDALGSVIYINPHDNAKECIYVMRTSEQMTEPISDPVRRSTGSTKK